LLFHSKPALVHAALCSAASGESLARTLASFPPGVQEALYGSTEALRALAAFNLCEPGRLSLNRIICGGLALAHAGGGL